MMEEGVVGPGSSHFMESDREPMSSRLVVDEEEEFYDFLPFQSEFLIPLRDRAFSWDVSFEDEIHAENEAAAISVISEQQDSHRLVIKAKASSGVKRQAEVKEAPPVEAAVEPAAKKGKNGSAAKKKESPAITSPTLQASKANLKTAATSSSANSSNGKPPIKGGAKNVPAATKAAVAAKKIFNVASSPSTEHLDTQTLRNTLNNAKSNADKTDFSSIKGEFGDLTGGMPFGFGSEFDVVSGGRHSVAFDDHLNMQFKQEDDFHDLSEEFGDEFRPPRKLSWSIDFNAIEAAMGGSLMNPMGEDAYNHGIAGGDPQMGYGASYSFESNLDHSANQAFPSLLRASETPGNNSTAAGSHIHPPGPMNINHQKPGLSMGSGVSGGHMGQGHYHPGSSSDHHSSGPASAASSSSSSMTAKMTDRDQLASMMGGNTHSTAHTHSQPHTNGQALAAAYAHSSGGGSNNASGLSSSSSSAMHNTGGGDSNHSSSSTVGGLTLGGLTVPNDGEFRVGAYTKLERHLKIEAFREKKRTRIWRKQIKYDCRKRLADTRPRVKGRFVSRKGDKGGPFEGGEEGEGGAEGEGPDLSAPRPVLQQGAGMPGTTQGGPLSAGMMSHGNAHPNSGHPNSHTHPHGNVHGNAHHGNMGMHKLATGYTGNLSAGAGSDHSAVGSSMAGIKTEMKYSGSAHAIPNHLSQSHHQAQNHGGQHHQAHPLPSIPTMYTPGAASASGPHLNNLNRGNMTGMNGNHGAAHGHHQQGQAAGHGSQHGPVHSLLSQSQQQKLHQQQHMLHQQQNHQKQQQGVSQHQTSINPVNGSHNQHQHLQSGHVPISHAMSSHAAAHPAHPAHTQNGPAGQLHVGGQGTHQAARPSVPVVPTGLLLSGPSAAVLHSTAATSGAAQTIPSLPSVASHTASVSGGQNSSVAGAPNAGNPAFSSKK